MIRGISPIYPKKLVRAFGEKVFDIIEAAPERLRDVDGSGQFALPAFSAIRITIDLRRSPASGGRLSVSLSRPQHPQKLTRGLKAVGSKVWAMSCHKQCSNSRLRP